MIVLEGEGPKQHFREGARGLLATGSWSRESTNGLCTATGGERRAQKV